MSKNINQIVIDRATVESMEIGPVLAVLNEFIEERQSVLKSAGSLCISFSGWDDDEREIFEIPEARAWFTLLTEHFPYWLVLCDRVTTTIPLVFNLLLPCGEANRTAGGEDAVLHSGTDIQSLFQQLTIAQNQLCIERSIQMSTSVEWTREVAECLNAYSEEQEP